MSLCELNSIFLGEVTSVQDYGVFVRIPGCPQQGLVHRSQISSSHVDNVSDILSRGERIWCKVITIGEDGKIGLSMKHADQGSGKDLDPNGVKHQIEAQRRKNFVPQERKPIKLEAILNTVCAQCGTRGHLKKDCFTSPDGKKYELIPEIEDIPDVGTSTRKQHKSKKVKKEKKSRKRDNFNSLSNQFEDNLEGNKRRRHSENRKHEKKRDYRLNEGRSAGVNLKHERKKGNGDGLKESSKKRKHSRSRYSD